MTAVESTGRIARWTAITVAVCAALALTACSHKAPAAPTDGSPQALTAAQAQRLAIYRFNAYQDGMRAVKGTVVGDQSVTIDGWVDTVKGRGYAIVQAPDAQDPGAFLTEWTASEISAQDFTGAKAPLPPPTTGWESTTLDPKSSVLAAAQTLLVSLSSDRPDNAQLLAQNGAKWLGPGTVDGTPVDIMSGPVSADSANGTSSYRYWIDKDGNLLRVQVLLDGLHLSTFDFSKASGVTF